jgi:poly(3-hydroxyalkanoate) synthetase
VYAGEGKSSKGKAAKNGSGKNGKHHPYPATVEEWWAGATEHPGSWWPDWDKWLSKRSGGKVPARKPGGGKLKALGDAPGTYVAIKAQGSQLPAA